MYQERFGQSRREMNRDFLSGLKIASVLEVGANIGNQLAALIKDWPAWNLEGIDINAEAIRQAKIRLPQAKIIQGSGFDLPYRDNQFDLVFTSAVLINVEQANLPKILGEIYRVARHYIWGYECYAPETTPINYRGVLGQVWKDDFAAHYQKLFPLKLLKEKRYPYLNQGGNVDVMFLLEKSQLANRT